MFALYHVYAMSFSVFRSPVTYVVVVETGRADQVQAWLTLAEFANVSGTMEWQRGANRAVVVPVDCDAFTISPAVGYGNPAGLVIVNTTRVTLRLTDVVRRTPQPSAIVVRIPRNMISRSDALPPTMHFTTGKTIHSVVAAPIEGKTTLLTRANLALWKLYVDTRASDHPIASAREVKEPEESDSASMPELIDTCDDFNAMSAAEAPNSVSALAVEAAGEDEVDSVPDLESVTDSEEE